MFHHHATIGQASRNARTGTAAWDGRRLCRVPTSTSRLSQACGPSGAVTAMVRVLGLDAVDETHTATGAESALSTLVERLIAQRAQARADKDWTTADRIRDVFAGAGVVLEDTADGTVWSIDG